ncbi:cytochrome P450 [Pseudovirgaria hyperparasitica]|uniref:Cytochrome P450 n=1 Tax=Pseudovirgaria hyperparasitica TaxID=470096 RepID=A0A6A6WCP2_9PEZI|nr:cytochrome P450 [Pseudovirgaria hyperparasitica]KAF2760602.1 cytochrome P450 [Pseudovirgaria hyperparasitica]
MKEPVFYEPFGAPGAGDNVFTTADPKLHSLLRRTMANSFSRKSILEFEPQIWDTANKMTSVLQREFANRPRNVNVSSMLRCMMLDVISVFAFGKDMGALDKEGFAEEVLTAFNNFDTSNFMFQGSPRLRQILLPILSNIPIDNFQAVTRMLAKVDEQLAKISLTDKSSSALLKGTMESREKMGLPVTKLILRQEGLGAIFAGTDTTAISLTYGTWAILSNEAIRSKLTEELRTVWAHREEHPSLNTLEGLPYLQACVKESLRYATSVSGRLPRVVGEGGLSVQNYNLPPGTVVSSSNYLMHFDEDVFPQPFVFDPSRWHTGDVAALKLRNRHLVPFSEGSRRCVGMNLAQAEMYITLASIFRWFKAVEVVDKEIRGHRILTTAVPDGVWAKVASIKDEVERESSY